MMKPTNRSMIVHAAPNTTCMNTSGHRVLVITTTTIATNTTPANTKPTRGHDVEVRNCGWGTCVGGRRRRLRRGVACDGDHYPGA